MVKELNSPRPNFTYIESVWKRFNNGRVSQSYDALNNDIEPQILKVPISFLVQHFHSKNLSI